MDETYGQVTIDSVKLDPVMVRYFMAQKVMPSIKDRIVAANTTAHFSISSWVALRDLRE